MARVARIILASITALSSLVAVTPARATEYVADVHTLRTPPLGPGQIELLTVSTFPDAVTGGDVMVRVRGLKEGDALSLRVNDQPVASPQAGHTPPVDSVDVLVDGLVVGQNTITATVHGPAGHREAALSVVNHPVSGPVLSGPHQIPFRCRTQELGLGAPQDEDCFAPTKYQWFYFSNSDLAWHELADPSASYPSDTAMTELASEDPALDGKAVPFVARLETAIINRGVARIAVLDDPAARESLHDFRPNWNGRVYHSFGESCGFGYDQGRNAPNYVLGGTLDPDNISADTIFSNLVGLLTRVGEGDVVVHSTLTSYGNHCNPFISIETAMMLKEHITETYSHRSSGSEIRTYIGTGSSGGALQQYNAANNAPGLLDGAMPGASFADIATTAMTVTDCGLFVRYFANTTLDWSEAQRAIVTGHNAQSGTSLNSICQSWTDAFLDRIVPTTGCVPDAVRYHPVNNPTGVRCTIQDANVNWLGRNPQTGFARRPLDNVGVQYGLRAFNAGLISFEQFADLNRAMGGWDIDGNHQAARHAMEPEVAAVVYKVGQVIGRGAMAETPIIDFAPYLDLIPVANIHESSRPFIIRHRLRRAGGDRATMAMWRGLAVQSDAFEQIDEWVAQLNLAAPGGNRIDDIIRAKPLTAIDQCALGTIGGRVEPTEGVRAPTGIPLMLLPGQPDPAGDVHMKAFIPEDHESGIGPCSATMPPVTTTRIAAGGPPSDDVIKCRLKAVDPNDYTAQLTPGQLDELESIFGGGVCDWSKPSVGDVEASIRWPSIGGRTPYLDGNGEPAPVGLVWRTARSG